MKKAVSLDSNGTLARRKGAIAHGGDEGPCPSMRNFGDDEPSARVLAALGVRSLAALGGRLNRHWLVDRRGARLVLRRWAAQPSASIEFERRLVAALAVRGWPVAPLEEPIEIDGFLWSLAPFLTGEPPASRGPEETRLQGRLLAEFHLDAARIENLGQRPGWRRCEAILNDPALDRVLSASEARRPEEVRIVRWHLDRARSRIEGIGLQEWASIPIHGDLTPWNLRFEKGRLSGLIDFELARLDHRVADFALSWRGKYDAIVEGYEEVSPLSPAERAMITPIWWAELVEGACRELQSGRNDDGWIVGKLLTRSTLMGPDAEALP